MDLKKKTDLKIYLHGEFSGAEFPLEVCMGQGWVRGPHPPAGPAESRLIFKQAGRAGPINKIKGPRRQKIWTGQPGR